MRIDYCEKCGHRITESDFTADAVEVTPNRWLCRNCVPATTVSTSACSPSARKVVTAQNNPSTFTPLTKAAQIPPRKKSTNSLPLIAGGICVVLALVLFLVTYSARRNAKLIPIAANPVPSLPSKDVAAPLIPRDSPVKRVEELVPATKPKDTPVVDKKPLTVKQDAPKTEVQVLPATTQTLTLDLGNGVTMECVYIRPGTFEMGGRNNSKEGRFTAVETPKHWVTITKGFYLGKYEVTQAQYQAMTGSNPSKSTKDPNCPVDNTRWENVLEFCQKASEKTKRIVRLPTEAEWEYACRAGTATDWSHGSDPARLIDYAWIDTNAEGRSHPVGQKKPNPWGLYDMHGNVCERVSDRYDKNYYASSPKEDPTGASGGVAIGANSTLLLRGGTWKSNADDCNSGARLRGGGFGNYDNWGFRAAVSASTEDKANH